MKLRNKKTGGLASILADEQDFIRVYTDAGWHDYDSVAEMMEEWEDYQPAEPLIKDEKVRKAVRAWAEAFDVEKIYYDARPLRLHDSKYETSIGIKHPVLGVWDRKEPYTIAELCGEEEE